MGVLLWIGYAAAAIVVIALVVGAGLFIGTVLAAVAILALCVVTVILVAATIKEAFGHITRERKRRAKQE